MFKKTLVAAAIMCASSSAYAWKVDTNITATTGVSNVGKQSTQTVLQFQKGKGSEKAIFEVESNTEAVQDISFVRVELTGGAIWNLAEAKAGAVVVKESGTGVLGGETTWTLLEDGKVLRVPVTTSFTTGAKIKVLADGTGAVDLRNATGEVKLKVGVQETDGSFSAEPLATNTVFALVDVLKLDIKANCNVANVSDLFKTLDDTGLTKTTPARICTASSGAKFSIENQTSNQQILADQIKLKMTGDFTNVTEITEATDTSKWTIATDKQSAEATVDVAIAGGITKGGTPPGLIPTFTYKADTPIPAMSYKLNVTLDTSATFDKTEFSDGGDIIVITHDGFSFDTVTTGTSAANTIYIRDVSNNLPAAGGVVNVTITEYDDAGKGTVFATKALSTNLPNNGALTLTPAGIASDLGYDLTEGKQARFFFEVETEKGEAAVKKQVAGIGIDIQTGSNNTDVNATL